MQKRWKLAAMACVAMACTWQVGQTRVQAEEQEKEVRIEVKVDASADGESSSTASAIKKRVIAVAVHAHGDLDKKIEEILKESGLKGDKLQEAIDKVLKVCKESCGAGASTIRQLQMPQVTVIGPDGKQQKIELRRGTGAIALHGMIDQELSGEISEKVEQALKKAGLEDAKMEQVRKALERVGQMQMPHGMKVGPQAIRVQATSDHKYMIGLACAPLNDALRSDLKLADGLGLVVINAFDDTPAEKAGIKEGDVLVKVGGKDVSDIQDLVGAVQAAGKDKKKLALQLIRDGKKQSVQVEPAERETLNISVDADIDETMIEKLKLDLPEGAEHGFFLMKEGPVRIGELGPGVIAPSNGGKANDQAVKALKKQVEGLSRQLKAVQAELKELKANKD